MADSTLQAERATALGRGVATLVCALNDPDQFQFTVEWIFQYGTCVELLAFLEMLLDAFLALPNQTKVALIEAWAERSHDLRATA